jgi:hypothetical protein
LSPTTDCQPRGPGLLFSAAALPSLSVASPAQTTTCELVSVKVQHGPGQEQQQLRLSDLCQQGLVLIDQGAVEVHRQQVPGCL